MTKYYRKRGDQYFGMIVNHAEDSLDHGSLLANGEFVLIKMAPLGTTQRGDNEIIRVNQAAPLSVRAYALQCLCSDGSEESNMAEYICAKFAFIQEIDKDLLCAE